MAVGAFCLHGEWYLMESEAVRMAWGQQGKASRHARESGHCTFDYQLGWRRFSLRSSIQSSRLVSILVPLMVGLQQSQWHLRNNNKLLILGYSVKFPLQNSPWSCVMHSLSRHIQLTWL